MAEGPGADAADLSAFPPAGVRARLCPQRPNPPRGNLNHVPITSNIAEGFERGGNKEFVQFLSNSKGSCGEVRSQLYVALDENYVTESEFHGLYDLSQEIGRTIDGFMAYLRTSNIRGRKYQDEQTTLNF